LNGAVEQAFEEWSALLGQYRARSDRATINLYSRTTLPDAPVPQGVLYPSSTSEVQEIVTISGKYQVSLYPISRGRNWGYGDACPVREGQVIVDMSRMNKILEVNQDLAYAVIESGVTQQQLYRHLEENYPGLMFDCTGSGPEASIVGNTLERGFGHTPYGDHFLYSCGMEVVLGDGRIVKTGFGHYKHARANHVFKWGIGPYLDGLFTQSNYGIVTRMGVWLMPKPQCIRMFYLSLPTDDALPDIVEALRPLRLQGVIKSIVHIGNDLRVLSSFQKYPWEESGGHTPLAEDLRRNLRLKNRIGAWNISGAVYGTHRQVRVYQSIIKKKMRHLGRVKFIGSNTVALAGLLANLIEKLSAGKGLLVKIRSLEKVFGLLNGRPTEAFMYGALWRTSAHKEIGSLDPLENMAGLLWISPILPSTGEAAMELMDTVNPIFYKYSFEPLVTVSFITERAMVSVMSICYNKENPEETRNARDCYAQLFETLIKTGFVPYRSSIHSMHALDQDSQVFWDITREIKQVLDPGGIIAPGRYQPKYHKNTF